MENVVFSARKNFIPKSNAHSATLLINEDGSKEDKKTGYHCYSHITYSESAKFDHLFVFFGESKIDEKSTRWADWVINRSFWADAFLTKDTKEGFELGFELDTSAERVYMQGAMMILRHAFEFTGWGFADFVDAGASELEAFALSVHYAVRGKYFSDWSQNTNHIVIQKGNPLHHFEGGGYTPNPDSGTLKTGYKGCMGSCSDGGWKSAYKKASPFPSDLVWEKKTNDWRDIITKYPLTEQNVEILIKAMKGFK